MNSDLDEYVIPPDDNGDGSKKPPRPRGAGQMWLPAPSKNSLEHYFRSQIITESFLQKSISFVDEDGLVERKHRSEFADYPEDSPELIAACGRIFALLQRHVSLCRSLGEAPTVADYHAACKANGMTPLHLPPNEYK